MFINMKNLKCNIFFTVQYGKQSAPTRNSFIVLIPVPVRYKYIFDELDFHGTLLSSGGEPAGRPCREPYSYTRLARVLRVPGTVTGKALVSTRECASIPGTRVPGTVLVRGVYGGKTCLCINNNNNNNASASHIVHRSQAANKRQCSAVVKGSRPLNRA